MRESILEMEMTDVQFSALANETRRVILMYRSNDDLLSLHDNAKLEENYDAI